jgi:hypothetical protein
LAKDESHPIPTSGNKQPQKKREKRFNSNTAMDKMAWVLHMEPADEQHLQYSCECTKATIINIGLESRGEQKDMSN